MKRTEADVVIVGAGFSGIGVAIALQSAGIDDFWLLEKGKELGGTWRDNTYPGCACDVPSQLYSFSYAPKSDWSRVFAPQSEIQDYTIDVADKFGVLEKIRFESEALEISWDDHDQTWTVTTPNEIFVARFVVGAQGPLHEVRIPEIAGLNRFKGNFFHSARWDHGHDLRGRRVAVVGTGSSAIQFIPKIQPQVEKLNVFQRTPGWVLPKPDHAIPPAERWAFENVPFFQKGLRKRITREPKRCVNATVP
ncbi:MAG: NAD(P)/FAD-dependent oxidoreductase [Polyangiales bacterium]